MKNYLLNIVLYSSFFQLIVALKSQTNNSAGIANFEMEYGHWVEKQNRQICELRTALNAHTSDIELRILVDGIMNHYSDLFRMKSAAAKVDVFYVLFGMWKSTAERFFLWIGGFRPSELLKVMLHIKSMEKKFK